MPIPETFQGLIERIAQRLYQAEPDEEGMKEPWHAVSRWVRSQYMERACDGLVAAAVREAQQP